MSDEVRLDELLAYVEFSAADGERLAAMEPGLAPHFRRFADHFYQRVLADAGARAIFQDAAQVERQKDALVAWMASGLRGPHDEAFYQRRSRIGRRHVQIGLAQHYMLTSMNVLRNDYIETLTTRARDSQDLGEQIKSVNRLFDIELAIMLRHYQVHSEEQLLAQERRRQNEKVAAMQALTAGLAHEVRNPLNSAKLQLSLLQRRLAKLGVDRSLQEPAKLVHDEIDRLTALLNEFLAFARPPRLDTQEQDLRVLLGHVVELERPGAVARQIELVIAPHPTPLMVRIDGPKMHQVVFNLVRNALEAVAPGGRVEVSLAPTPKHAVIAVADNGHGIAPEVLQRIYEPFFSTKPEGTGIGMAIVQNLVQLHGGSLEIETSPRGTVFKVLLPLALAATRNTSGDHGR